MTGRTGQARLDEACHDTLDCIVTGGLEGLKEARFVSQYTLVYCDKMELGMRLGLCRDTARHSACAHDTRPAPTSRPSQPATRHARSLLGAPVCSG